MRFILAALSMAVSLTMLVVGFLQIAEARARDHVTLAGEASSGAPIVVIPSETLTDRSGAQTIEIEGDGPITAVVGRQADVAGWIGSATHDRAEPGDQQGQLRFTSVPGQEASVPSPSGSDLWYREDSAENGRLRIEPGLPPGFAIMIVGDGSSAPLSTLSITWPLDGRAPWAGPLLIGGAFFLLLALALLLWQLLRMRRDRQPRRKAAEASAPLAAAEASEVPGAARPAGESESAAAFTLDPETGLVQTAAGGRPGGSRGPDGQAVPGAAGDPPHEAAYPASGADPAAQAWTPGAPAGEAPGGEAPAGGFAAGGVAAPPEPGPVPAYEPATAAMPLPDATSAPMATQLPQGDDAHAMPPLSPQYGSAEPGASAAGYGVVPDAADGASSDAPAAAAGQQPGFRVPDGSSFAVAGEPADAPHEPAGFLPPEDSAFVSAHDPGNPAAGEGSERAGDDEHDDERRGRHDGGPGDGLGSSGPSSGGAAAGDGVWKRPRGRDRSNAPKRAFRIAQRLQARPFTGRGAFRFARTARLLPALLVSGLALSGCSANFWPESIGGAGAVPTATPTSTIDEALMAEGAPYPALSQQQLLRIIDDVRSVTSEADAARDAEALKARYTHSAWAERNAYYALQGADQGQPAPPAFPAGKVVYTIPQATAQWPRTVFTVIESDQPETPSYAVMLFQETARDAYKIASLVPLVNVQMPQAAPVEIGSAGLDEVASGLALAPDQLVTSYGDIIMNGDASAASAKFSPENDWLREQIGQAYRDKRTGEIDQAASKITFANRPAANVPPIGVSTLDGGAIVAVTMEEVETLAATSSIATLSASGKTALLAGTSSSPYGFERVYSDQLLFYVPPAEAGGQIRFLGSSQQMVSGRQLDASEVNLG